MEEKISKSIYKYNRLAIVGDNIGIPQLIKYVPKELIKCIIGASIREQYINFLRQTASTLGIPLLIQPKWKSKDYKKFVKNFKELKIDLIISNSYSMLIRKDILQIVNFNSVNTHSGFLPKNRGPNPIQWAIIKGEPYAGVTIHYMDGCFDTGDIIAQKKVKIDFKDTWVTLQKKIFLKTDSLLKEAIPEILKGMNKRIKQNEREASINERLDSNYPVIDLKKMPDLKIYNLIRAQVKPLNGAYLQVNNKRIHFDKFIELAKIKEIRKLYEK